MFDNPFIFGEKVGGKTFCNRKAEIKELLRDIEDGQNLIIFSPRRYGKTSLVQTILSLAEKRGVVCVYADLFSALTEADFARLLARAVAESIRGPVEKILSWFKENLLKLRPKIVLEEDGSAGFTFAVENNMTAIPDIEDMLTAVYRYFVRAKKKGVIVFDEFQQIGQFPTDKLERKLRTIIQGHRNICYIFMGSKKHLLHDIFSNPTRPFYRSAKHFPLGKIGHADFSKFISERFESSGKKIDHGIIEKILSTSECHPYYTQMISHAVWEKVDEKGLVHFRDIMETVLARETSAFQNTWDMITTTQKQALVAIANKKEKDKIFSSEYLSRFGLSSASAFQKALKILYEKDFLSKENNNWEIQDVLFKLWIRAHSTV
ncbi:MAG: ATP-binding protein [Deltaproteobacteria bacterium]|nr:ATP-binding protein [Deltaproteobacteria bacterium]